MNEYDAHESSYDHQHKKRLKEMKEMQRQVAPKKEEKGPLMQIKLGGTPKSAGGAGFRKGAFKNAFAPAEASEVQKEDAEKEIEETSVKDEQMEEEDSDITDDDDYYDPRKPTGCTSTCASKVAMGVT